MKNTITKLKQCIVVFALIFASTNSAVAQKAEIGVRFMPTISSFEMNTSAGGKINGEVTLGYGVGGFVGYNFTNHIGIQGEVIYTSLTQHYYELDVKRKINLRYVNIPLLLSLNTGKSKVINFNLVAGPQLGLGVGSSVETSGNNNGTVTTEAMLSVKKNDIGLAYGAGFDIGLPAKLRLGLGFRGVYGLIDISNNSKTNTTNSYYIIDRTHLKTYSGYIGLSFLF